MTLRPCVSVPIYVNQNDLASLSSKPQLDEVNEEEEEDDDEATTPTPNRNQDIVAVATAAADASNEEQVGGGVPRNFRFVFRTIELTNGNRQAIVES